MNKEPGCNINSQVQSQPWEKLVRAADICLQVGHSHSCSTLLPCSRLLCIFPRAPRFLMHLSPSFYQSSPLNSFRTYVQSAGKIQYIFTDRDLIQTNEPLTGAYWSMTKSVVDFHICDSNLANMHRAPPQCQVVRFGIHDWMRHGHCPQDSQSCGTQ